MLKNKRKSILCALLGVVLLFSCVAFPASGASTEEQIEALRERNKELQAQIDEAEQKMAQISEDINQRQTYADELSTQISGLQAQIDVLNQSIDAIQVKIDELLVQIEQKNREIEELDRQRIEAQEQINDCEKQIEETYDRLKSRLRSLYINGSLSELELLLSSDNFSAYLSSMQLMESMAEHDDALIKSIESDIQTLQKLQETIAVNKQKVEEAKVVLQQSKSDREAAQSEIEEDRAVIANAKAEIQAKWDDVKAVIADLDAQNDAYQSLKESYEREMNEASEEIDALIRAQMNSGQASTGSGQPSGAGLVWPVQSGSVYTTTEYGQGGHGGLDITCNGASNLTTPIYAAASGVVIVAEWHYSYGNYIVIDHGDGLSTLYAHCNSISVSVGEHVSQNQQIGIVGNTGNSFGAHCHFEVRVNGSRTNPRNYL